jgi:hypothetical protein
MVMPGPAEVETGMPDPKCGRVSGGGAGRIGRDRVSRIHQYSIRE